MQRDMVSQSQLKCPVMATSLRRLFCTSDRSVGTAHVAQAQPPAVRLKETGECFSFLLLCDLGLYNQKVPTHLSLSKKTHGILSITHAALARANVAFLNTHQGVSCAMQVVGLNLGS